MDNRDYKSLRLDAAKLNTLPYPDEATVRYAGGTSINAQRLNNTFNQLADNDRFVANQLIALSGAVAGPDYYNPGSPSSKFKMESALDGYKAWQNGSNDDLSIIHKIDRDLQNSVISTALTCATYDFYQVAGTTFAATSDGIFTFDDKWSPSRFEETYEDSEKTDVGACYQIFHDGVNVFFATDSGVFELNSAQAGGDSVSRKALYRRNATPLKGCRSVFLHRDSKILYASAADGVYMARYGSNTAKADLKFSKIELVKGGLAQNAKVSGFALLKPSGAVTGMKNDVLALTDDGLYRNDEISSVIGANSRLIG